MEVAYEEIPKIITLVFLIILMALVSGCQGAREPDTVKVVFLQYLSNSPFFIAQEEGFFEEQGITIEFVEMQRSSEAIPAIQQGDVDVVGGAMASGLLNAINRGANIKLVADKGHLSDEGCVNSALLASKAFLESNTAQSKSDLAGVKLSANPASITDYYTEVLLAQSNLTQEDIDLVNHTSSVEFETMMEGTIDLVQVDEPWITRILQAGYGQIWVSSGDLVPDFSYAQVWFGPTLVDDNPELGERFMVAFLKGVAQYKLGKTDRNVEIIVKHTGLDEQIVRDACWASVKGDGMLNLPDTMEFQQWALENDLQDEIVPVEKFWDPHFIEYAAKELNLP